MKTMPTTAAKPKQLQALFGALGDSTRYRIISLLKSQPELCVSEVAASIGISPAGVSQHMKVLESSGLVRPLRVGQRTCYQLLTAEASNRVLLKLID